MTELFSEITQGLSSGEAYPLSLAFFNLSFLLFLVSTIGYFTYVAVRKNWAWAVGFVPAVLAAVFQTLALGARWYAAGWEHPPFSNLYESLVFFAWGVVVVYMLVEIKWKVRAVGAFVMPFALVAMGLASLSPNKAIEPLVPALQSVWLHLHVVTASIGYAAFLVAFGFSVLFLVKDGVRKEWFGLVSVVLFIIGASVASRGLVFVGRYPMPKIIWHEGGFFLAQHPETGERIFSDLPWAGSMLLVSVLVAVFTVVMLAVSARVKSHRSGRIAFQSLLFTTFLGGFSIAYIIVQSARFEEFTLRASVYSFAVMVVGWIAMLATSILHAGYKGIVKILPDARTLDDLAYKSVVVAFPIMTLVIVTGAIWANKAWGRYWGWDPKETASLVTWLIYLLFLHARITAGWQGRRTALISIIGFASVLFTYLGVNLLIPGLHAYATG